MTQRRVVKFTPSPLFKNTFLVPFEMKENQSGHNGRRKTTALGGIKPQSSIP
jgi:hypothetical protein